MSGYSNNSIFWVETGKIQPNPFQPRREFEQNSLADLADSIRQYGVLQPLVVTRSESYRDDGGMEVSYELIAGERRLRASKLAGLQQVPVIIRKETNEKEKLELAIIENLQREDLNPIDRALAFEQLYKQFELTHADIGKKMGKSRVYVSNTLRLLALPDNIKQALMEQKITEGHTRPLLMLVDRPEEQATLFREIIVKNMSVRDAEKIARSVAQDKVRKKEFEIDPKIRVYEKKMSENLGTRVHIEPKEKGGKIVIDYFTLKDLDTILAAINVSENKDVGRMMQEFIDNQAVAQKDAQQEDLMRSTAVSFREPENIEAQQTPEPVIQQPAPEPVAKQQTSESEEDHVSDFLTGNPYKHEVPELEQEPRAESESFSESTADVQEAEQTFQQPAEAQVPQKAPDYAAMYAAEKKKEADNIVPQQVPVTTIPEREVPQEAPEGSATSNYQQAPTVDAPRSEVIYNPFEETQTPVEKSVEAPVTDYSKRDPLPVVPEQRKDVYRDPLSQDRQYNPTTPNTSNGSPEIHRTSQQSYDKYQPPVPTNNGYPQDRSSVYGNTTYQQQPPQKKSFFKKLFG